MGQVVAIYISGEKTAPMTGVPEVRAVAGKGLEGDRYFGKAATFRSNRKSAKELTLIEQEAVEASGRDYGIEIDASETRRNIVTSGVALNHLVGREFQVGEVRARGTKLCEPCGLLEKLTGKPVRKTLQHRGGLRAEILTDGTISVGDPIRT
ncbi:MAG TPA: MOSC domain-containing protein [Actinomycetota bacterium]|nr:MOSC domain-containing protein [Actinomycetota bacterium]